MLALLALGCDVFEVKPDAQNVGSDKFKHQDDAKGTITDVPRKANTATPEEK